MTAEQPLTLNDIARSIAAIDHKVIGLADRFDGLESRFDNLETKVGSLETTMSRRFYSVESRLTDLETGQRHIVERLEGVEGETKALHNDVIELYDLALS